MIFPLANLVGLNPIFTGNLRHGPLAFDTASNATLALKGCLILVAFHYGHFTIPPLNLWQAVLQLITMSSFWEHFILA